MTFADRIRERYPEGLTGVFAVGGSRTTLVLEKNRHAADPGHIDMVDYANFSFGLLSKLMATFYELGGQNIICPVLSYQQFSNERGSEYAELITASIATTLEGSWVEFYRELDIDPYYVGIDTVLALPELDSAYKLCEDCAEFQKNWTYKEGRCKLIWEVAPIPLYSIWRAHQVMGEEAQAQLEAELSAVTDLQTMHDILYRYYARAVYGTDVPYPHFYFGSNRNGDLKLRSLLPIALLCGGPFRLYYTPYPSFFTTRETMQAILEDLAFGKTITSSKNRDYSGQYTPELAENEYQRILELSADPRTTLGFARKKQLADGD